MSGGRFDYKQYEITMIADSIQSYLDRQGTEIPKERRYFGPDHYNEYPEDKYYQTYPEEIQEKMREAVKALRIAGVYAQRVDWFLSGDDGPENFLNRLKEELNAFNS